MIIRNGTVVSATDSYKADVAVKDGKIAAVGSIPDIPGAKVVDAAGKLGFVHLRITTVENTAAKP